MNTSALKMLTPDHLDRRTCLKGLSLGAGAVVLQPFVDALAAEAAAMKDRLKANVPAIDKFDSKLVTDRLEAHCAIAASAITSGLTNVVNIDASGVGYYTWKELGVMTDGHSIGHMHPDQPKRDKLCIPIRKFHAQRVADLAKRLDSVKEGNGTVLDNTLIVWMSDSGEEHHGFCREWPLVLIGNLGGRLKTAGRFLQFPTYKDDGNQIPGHRTIANFYLALLHAVGDKRDFLRIGSLCGLTMPGLLAAQAQAATEKNAYKNKSVVFLFLQGGPPQIETFDPKLDVPDNNRSCTGDVRPRYRSLSCPDRGADEYGHYSRSRATGSQTRSANSDIRTCGDRAQCRRCGKSRQSLQGVRTKRKPSAVGQLQPEIAL